MPIHTKKREEYTRMIEAIKNRERNFKINKKHMLASALNRRRSRINTSTIIYEDKFIDDPTQVKKVIQDSAKKWTRKRHLDLSIPG